MLKNWDLHATRKWSSIAFILGALIISDEYGNVFDQALRNWLEGRLLIANTDKAWSTNALGDNAFFWRTAGILNGSTFEKSTCMVCCEYVELEQETQSQTVTQLKNGFERICHTLCEICIPVMSGAAAIQGRGKKRITNICEIQHAAVNRVNCPVSDRSGVPCEIQPFAGAGSVSHATFHTDLIDCYGNTECVCSTCVQLFCHTCNWLDLSAAWLIWVYMDMVLEDHSFETRSCHM